MYVCCMYINIHITKHIEYKPSNNRMVSFVFRRSSALSIAHAPFCLLERHIYQQLCKMMGALASEYYQQ